MILSVFDRTGIWSAPYRDAGYHVEQVDLQLGMDARTLPHYTTPVRGIILQPPCDHFAVSGARWWKDKGHAALLEGLELVRAGLSLVAIYDPRWWVLENPVGRLKDYIGPPAHYYDPCDYGDPYTKRTCLWGRFRMPFKTDRVEPTEGSKMHRVPPGPERKNIRSATPPGFARAFFEANP